MNSGWYIKQEFTTVPHKRTFQKEELMQGSGSRWAFHDGSMTRKRAMALGTYVSGKRWWSVSPQ